MKDRSGNTIDLTGLNPFERAWCLMAALGNPSSFQGNNANSCTVGQAARAISGPDFDDPDEAVLVDAVLPWNDGQTEARGRLDDAVHEIWLDAAEEPYKFDFWASLDHAAKALGVDAYQLCRRLGWAINRPGEAPNTRAGWSL